MGTRKIDAKEQARLLWMQADRAEGVLAGAVGGLGEAPKTREAWHANTARRKSLCPGSSSTTSANSSSGVVTKIATTMPPDSTSQTGMTLVATTTWRKF